MLFEIYSKLAQAIPNPSGDLYGEPISPSDGLWLAVDDEFCPSLLFPSSRGDERSDIALRSIDVEFSRECSISTPGSKPIVGIYSIVRLNQDDPEIIRVFLRLLEEAFCEPVARFTNRQIGDRILELADLFSRTEGSGDVLGLWGELYVIMASSNPAGAVRNWCSHKKAKHDFVANEFAIEVKTTLRPTRQHCFSIDQLRPTSGFSVFVASIQLAEAQGGRTVSELVEEIHAGLEDPELRAAFFAQCLRKVGGDIYRSSLRLKLLPDGSSLAIFDAKTIPVPAVNPSDPITNLRFDVDLTHLTAVDEGVRQMLLSFSK